MSISEMHEFFDLLTDKVGVAYFTDDERDRFINMSQLEYVKRALPSTEGGVVNVEYNQVVANNLLPLIYETDALTMSAQGVITVTAAQTALDTATSTTDPFIYVMNVSWVDSTTKPVRYTRHNDWYEFESNRFKRGTASQPRYKYDSVNFTFSPADPSAEIYITFLKQPRDVNRVQGIDCELPAHTHKNIVEGAVALATVSLGIGNPQKESNG